MPLVAGVCGLGSGSLRAARNFQVDARKLGIQLAIVKSSAAFAKKHWFLFIAVVALLPGLAAAQATPGVPPAPPLTLPQVAERLVQMNAARFQALQSYRGRRNYQIEYTGFHTTFHAEMTADVVYTAPDSKEFTIVSESGPKWLVSRVLKRLTETERDAQKAPNRSGVELNTQNYDFTSLEYHASDDGCSYVLTVQPKVPSKLLYRGKVWVHESDFAVCRIEAEPSKNPSLWITRTDIRQNYQKIGELWLPLDNQSISTVRLGGRAVLTIKYQNYDITATHLATEADPAR
jgi:outer membrane lipoprotein-sorting protein